MRASERSERVFETDGADPTEHERAAELLWRRFEDGSLPGEEERELCRHVRRCASCRAERDRLETLEEPFLELEWRARWRDDGGDEEGDGAARRRTDGGDDAGFPGEEEEQAA